MLISKIEVQGDLLKIFEFSVNDLKVLAEIELNEDTQNPRCLSVTMKSERQHIKGTTLLLVFPRFARVCLKSFLLIHR